MSARAVLSLVGLAAGFVVVGGSVLVWRALGWWALVVVPVALYLAVRYGGGWVLGQALRVPFRAKGAVLRGATATVHAVSRTAAPADTPHPDADYYTLDVTVVPAAGPGRGGFTLWEPGELRLVPAGAAAEDDDLCEVTAVEIEDEGRFVEEPGMKYEGPRHLRLTFAAHAGPARLTLAYYFESFGDVRLPGR